MIEIQDNFLDVSKVLFLNYLVKFCEILIDDIAINMKSSIYFHAIQDENRTCILTMNIDVYIVYCGHIYWQRILMYILYIVDIDIDNVYLINIHELMNIAYRQYKILISRWIL